VLRSQLEERKGDKARLERILQSLDVVDSVYRAHFPAWLILDEDLRQRIYRVFRGRHADLPHDTSVTVVTNPDMNEILQISIGPTTMGPLETHTVLSDSLRREILSAKYYLKRLEPAPLRQRKTLLFGARPRVVSMDASLFGGSLLFGRGWGVELKIGHDEVGYPFWSSGTARVMAVFDQLKLGVMVPLNFGKKEPRILEPLAIRPRRLNGPSGISAEFDQPLGSHLLSARFSVGELRKYIADALTDINKPYYLHTVGQLSYSHRLPIREPGHLITATLGVGFHQVALGQVEIDGRIVAIEKFNFLGPVLRVEYVRRGEDTYGVNLQYYNSLIYLNGWVELVRNFIYLDLRYSAPIFRGPRPWEQPYFYMVSPRFRLVY